jgi:hypothetical protein
MDKLKMMQSNKKINNKHTLFLYYFMSDRVVVYLLHIRAIKSKWPKSPSTVYWPDLIQVMLWFQRISPIDGILTFSSIANHHLLTIWNHVA